MSKPLHISFLKNTGTTLQTSDGKDVEVWELSHIPCENILSAWAKHFREHYCLDSQIDILRNGTGKSRRDYLTDIKFPSKTTKLGPSTRAGDFGEILVADFLKFIENYDVLSKTTRYHSRINRDVSDPGCDVIGVRFIGFPSLNPKDELAVFEAKAKFTGNATSETSKNRLQDAINDSAKDKFRVAVSLNAIKQRFIDKNNNNISIVERFQNEADNPYRTINGAVALVCDSNYSEYIATSADASNHPNQTNLRLIIIKGQKMMEFVHELYRRAADEA